MTFSVAGTFILSSRLSVRRGAAATATTPSAIEMTTVRGLSTGTTSVSGNVVGMRRSMIAHSRNHPASTPRTVATIPRITFSAMAIRSTVRTRTP